MLVTAQVAIVNDGSLPCSKTYHGFLDTWVPFLSWVLGDPQRSGLFYTTRWPGHLNITPPAHRVTELPSVHRPGEAQAWSSRNARLLQEARSAVGAISEPPGVPAGVGAPWLAERVAVGDMGICTSPPGSGGARHGWNTTWILCGCGGLFSVSELAPYLKHCTGISVLPPPNHRRLPAAYRHSTKLKTGPKRRASTSGWGQREDVPGAPSPAGQF